MNDALELSIVIPVFNEVATVATVIRAHVAAARSICRSFEVLVLDDASADDSWSAIAAAAAEACEVRAWRSEANLGITGSLRELYAATRGEFVYFVPSDGQIPPEALRILWDARAAGGCVVGRREPRLDPPIRLLMAALYSRSVRALFPIPATDLDSVKILDGPTLRAMPLLSKGNFAEAEMILRFWNSGRTVREIAIPHAPRRAGRASAVNPGLILDTYRDLARFTLSHLARGLRP